jgi:chaperonin GroES
LESISEAIDTTLNQMLDAGHLQNAGGGLIGSGIRLKKNRIEVAPGKYQQVEVSGDIRAQVYPFQHQGPSAVLFNLLGMLVEAARDITATKDIMTGDSNGKVQTATTTLALIEQGLKVFTAIYKRIYRAMKDEFKLLFELNARFLDEEEYYTFNDEQEVVARQDYDLASMDICPVADPSMVTDMQRQARTQILLQIAESPMLGPLQNGEEVLKRVYDVARIEESDKLLNKPNPMVAQIQEKGAIAEIENTMADTENKLADADKKRADTAKAVTETQMMPAELMLEANKQDMESAHRDMDRVKDHVNAEEDRAMGREQMEAKAKEAKAKKQAKG